MEAIWFCPKPRGGKRHRLTPQRGVEAFCWLAGCLIFISAQAFCLVAKEVNCSPIILWSLVFIEGWVRYPSSDWRSWISQMPLENLQENGFFSFVQDFSLDRTITNVQPITDKKLFKKHTMAIYLFFNITQILNFHYGINRFCSEFHHYLCSSISFMNKIDLNLFSSCCPQKWFPRWGIMSYKNIRLTLNMDSGVILFWNSCSINWLLVPQVNQIELGYMICCVKEKITLYMSSIPGIIVNKLILKYVAIAWV